MFGPGWSEVAVPLQYLSLAIMFRVSYKISESLTRAKAAVYRRAWRQGIFAIMVFLDSYIGSKYFGLSGVAIGILIAVIVNYCLMTDLSCRLLDLPYRTMLNSHLPAILLTMLVSVVGYLSAEALRANVSSDFLTISGVACLLAVVCILAISVLPKVFLGAEGYWTYQLMRKNFSLRT